MPESVYTAKMYDELIIYEREVLSIILHNFIPHTCTHIHFCLLIAVLIDIVIWNFICAKAHVTNPITSVNVRIFLTFCYYSKQIPQIGVLVRFKSNSLFDSE